MAHCTLKLRMRDGGRPRAVRDFASEAAEFKSDTEGMAWLGLFNSKGNTMPEDLDAIGPNLKVDLHTRRELRGQLQEDHGESSAQGSAG